MFSLLYRLLFLPASLNYYLFFRNEYYLNKIPSKFDAKDTIKRLSDINIHILAQMISFHIKHIRKLYD
jgi:hypothetical protein